MSQDLDEITKHNRNLVGGWDGTKANLVSVDTEGALRIKGLIDGTIDIETGHGKIAEDPAVGTISSATTTEVIAAAGSGIVTYVYGVLILGLSATINTVTVKRGTTAVTPPARFQGVGDAMYGFNKDQPMPSYVFKTAANEAVNIVTSSAESIDYQLLYWQE